MKAIISKAILFLMLSTSVRESHAQKNYTAQISFEQLKGKAEKGDAESQADLGWLYLNTLTNSAEALVWFRKAADKKSPRAFMGLAFLYRDPVSTVHDPTVAFGFFRQAAEAGDWKLKAAVGQELVSDPTNTAWHAEGLLWLKRALDAVLTDRSTTNYGFKFVPTTDSTVGETTTFESSPFAKEFQEAILATQLGDFYFQGKIVPKNLTNAIAFYTIAAERHWKDAQTQLCYVCEEAQNFVEAMKWYRELADQGEAIAQVGIGFLYEDGKGVRQDWVEAVKWYRKAADQGDANGQNNLGRMYKYGEGVPTDYVEAYRWFNLAAAQGDKNAAKSRDSITASMTPGQIAEAQRLARDFNPRKRSRSRSTTSDNDVADSSPTASGTGFFITDDGFLITNEHVVKEAAQVRLVTSAGIIAARVVKVDAANDLALLKAEGRFAALPVVASRAMRLGSTVATVGFPNVGLQGFAPKLARGEIAALSGVQDDARHFQISVPVQPGNSGGALVDERGNVVGVVSAKLSARAALAASGALPENVNYAVKSSFLLSFLESVPEVSAKILADGHNANTKERKFEDVVKSAEQAAVLVLVY